jgi:hypothetical protein
MSKRKASLENSTLDDLDGLFGVDESDLRSKVSTITEIVETMVEDFFGSKEAFYLAIEEEGIESFERLTPLSSFPGANQVFSNPQEWEGLSPEGIGDLAVHYTGEAIFSVWESHSEVHRLRYLLEGIATLSVYSRGLPPVAVFSGTMPEFNRK